MSLKSTYEAHTLTEMSNSSEMESEETTSYGQTPLVVRQDPPEEGWGHQHFYKIFNPKLSKRNDAEGKNVAVAERMAE